MARAPKATLTDAQKVAKTAEKAAKFKKLGGKRVSVALDKIALLNNLANKASYEYSPEEVEKMIKALSASVQHVKNTFDAVISGKKASTGGFEF